MVSFLVPCASTKSGDFSATGRLGSYLHQIQVDLVGEVHQLLLDEAHGAALVQSVFEVLPDPRQEREVVAYFRRLELFALLAFFCLLTLACSAGLVIENDESPEVPDSVEVGVEVGFTEHLRAHSRRAFRLEVPQT